MTTVWNTTAAWQLTIGSIFIIFGKNNGSWSFGLPATLLIWLFLLGLAPMYSAQTSLQFEHETGSHRWNVEELIERLAKNPESEVQFE